MIKWYDYLKFNSYLRSCSKLPRLLKMIDNDYTANIREFNIYKVLLSSYQLTHYCRHNIEFVHDDFDDIDIVLDGVKVIEYDRTCNVITYVRKIDSIDKKLILMATKQYDKLYKDIKSKLRNVDSDYVISQKKAEVNR